MSDFFKELAKTLAQRWVGLLFVPGALFVAGALLGVRLGHAHALDLSMASRVFTTAATSVAGRAGAVQVVVLVAALLASAGVGLLVQAMAGVTRGLWLGRWPGAILTARRVRKWERRLRHRQELEAAEPAAARSASAQDEIDRATARMNAVAMARPGRPTWMGDRIHAVEAIAAARYGLDLPFAWPRLWLTMPETARAEISAANGAFAAAVTVASWAWPTLLLGVFWWPAIVVAVVIGTTGWVRGRAAITDLTGLAESALDLYGCALATAVGVETLRAAGPMEVDEGAQVSAIFRKGR
ncbi:hypothetical protein GCM10027598_19010 [Amycolatopsis oliviviridis]|uniref:Vegetative cell wall protein gp1 n=1 Tax=Amycolatopsis oliviviridis TaxID=1471590 RepID=A0ABQ3LEI0_9PSEU|nr:hypothetical protein [Amycolatopsis oliviviridis]GHH13912.1 hypothetical protein GCM10017790_26660 [Amycolatopsis oliviviridis]